MSAFFCHVFWHTFLQWGEIPKEIQGLPQVKGATAISLSGTPANLTARSRRQLEAESINLRILCPKLIIQILTITLARIKPQNSSWVFLNEFK